VRTEDDSAPSKRPHQEGTSHKRHSALTPLNTQIAGRAQDLNICTHQTPPPPKQQQQQQQQQQHRHTCTSNTRCCVRPYVSLVLGCEVNVRPARDNTPRSLSLSPPPTQAHTAAVVAAHTTHHTWMRTEYAAMNMRSGNWLRIVVYVRWLMCTRKYTPCQSGASKKNAHRTAHAQRADSRTRQRAQRAARRCPRHCPLRGTTARGSTPPHARR
jgi:hypothetical protein